MLLLGAQQGLPEYGMSSAQAASECLAAHEALEAIGTSSSASHYPLLGVASSISHPCSWWHPAKSPCKPSGYDCHFLQGVSEASLGAGWLPAPHCCLTCSVQVGAAHLGQGQISSWDQLFSFQGRYRHSLTSSVPHMGHRQPTGQCDLARCFAWPNDAAFLPEHLSVPASCHPFVLDKAYSTSEI